MKEYLGFSYGVLVYQDDVLLTAINIAGYSWLEADQLRKAMGKKIPAEMEAQREKFTAGAVKHGCTKQKADQLWKLIEPFAAYGFNKAHAASYGRVAYQTAYMKANYPVEYMAAVLTAEAGDVDTTAVMVGECKRLGIPVLPPDVNESFGDFTVITTAPTGAIRFGLYSIKNFGRGVADEIIKERKAGGKFSSIGDFLSRLARAGLTAEGLKTQSLNKKGLESLIMCGALDSLGERGALLANSELLLRYQRESGAELQHDSLFAAMPQSHELRLAPAQPATVRERLSWEKELLGLYVSGHPLDQYKERLEAALQKSHAPRNINELRSTVHPGQTAVMAGIVQGVRTVLTRGGEQMAFVRLADYEGSIEAVLFPKNYTQYKNILKPDSCVALKGRVSNRNGELSMVAEALKAL